MRGRVWMTAALAAAAIALGGTPVAAEPPPPHVSDRCGDVVGSREFVFAEHDVCSGWFSSHDEDEDVPRIEVRSRHAGVVSDRRESVYYVGWHVDGCDFIFGHSDDNVRSGVGGWAIVECGDEGRRQMALPPTVFTFTTDERDVSMAVTFAEPLAGYASSHVTGKVLTEPFAAAAPGVAGWGMGVYGWDDNIGTWSVGVDVTSDSRPYTVGS